MWPIRKKLSIAAVTLAAATSITLLNGGPASALTGEGSWNTEFVAGKANLQTWGTLSEVRSNGYIVHAWTSAEGENNLWYNATPDNGALASRAVRLFSTVGQQAVLGSPVVINSGSGVQVWYTGLNHHIYRSDVFGPNGTIADIQNTHFNDTGLTSPEAVHVVQLGAGSPNVGITWVSDDSRRNIQYIPWRGSGDGRNGSYGSYINLGGTAAFGASIAYAPLISEVMITHTGTDGQVYTAHRSATDGSGAFTGWKGTGLQVAGTPNILYTPSSSSSTFGGFALAMRTTDTNIWFAHANQNGDVNEGPTKDKQGYQTHWDVNLTLDGNGNTVALMTGEDSNNVWWKEARAKQ